MVRDSTSCIRLDEAEVSIHSQERARPYNCRARRHGYWQSLLRHRTRASRSFKPTTFAERLRCVGNSSRNEIGSGRMKHWEIIADNLKKAGFSLVWVSALDIEE